MIRSLIDWWDRRRREIDLKILWPACKSQAPTLEIAKAAFMYHAVNDPAWNRHYFHDELVAYVDDLE